MEIIALTDTAFYALLDKVLQEMETKFGTKEPEWIPESQALTLLGLRSKTTLQKLRDTDAIQFTQPRKKIILYNRKSIMLYLEKHTNI